MNSDSIEAILARIDKAERQMQKTVKAWDNMPLDDIDFREWSHRETMLRAIGLLQKLQVRLTSDLLEKMLEEE